MLGVTRPYLWQSAVIICEFIPRPESEEAFTAQRYKNIVLHVPLAA